MNVNRLVWHAGLALGITPVDEAHAELVDLYNRIVEACEAGESATPVREKIRSFLLYARWHFGEEERYMRKSKYPKFVEHKASHDRLLQDAHDFVENLGGPLRGEDAIAVAKYFNHWLSRHTSGQDRQLRDFFVSDDGQPRSSISAAEIAGGA